jgi:hypothetical protein
VDHAHGVGPSYIALFLIRLVVSLFTQPGTGTHAALLNSRAAAATTHSSAAGVAMGDYGHGGQMRGPAPKGGQRPNVQQLKLVSPAVAVHLVV